MTVNPSEVAEEYRSSLVDLTVNSKPLITMLTMLAEENKDHASVIIGVIEDQILKAPSNQKLPVMYLIDSIVKNVGDHYTRGFANNLVKTFGSTFEKVDERTRKKLYELRQTWNDVFPGSRLYMMDVKVNQADPAWPITSQQPPGTIHINPKMINKKMSKTEQAPTTRSSGGKSQFQEITKKKEELLDIEKKKLAVMKKQFEIHAVPKEKTPVPEPPVEPTPPGSKERKEVLLRSYKIKKKTGPEKSEIKVGANIYVDPRRMSEVQLPPTAAAIVSRDPRLATPDSPVSPRDPRLASTTPTTPTSQESSPISDSPTGRGTKTSRPSLPPTSKRPDPRLEKSGEKEKEKDKDKDSSHKKKEKDKDDREKRKKEKDKEKEREKEKKHDRSDRSSRRDKEKSSNITSLDKLSTRSTIVSHREKDKKDKESSLISSSTNTVVPPAAPVAVPSNLLSPPPGIKPLRSSEDESSTVFKQHKSNKGRKQHVRTRRSESPDEATADTTSTVGSSSSPSSHKKRNRSQDDSESGDSDDYQANKPNPAAYHNKKVRKGEVSSSSSAAALVAHPTNTSGETDCGADVDLRQLTPTGKRSAQSHSDENTTPPKKEKLHFEEEKKEAQDPFGLFSGVQDVDLRQILAPPNMGPLVPPPGPPDLPAVFAGVVDQDLRTSSNMTSQDSLMPMASINTEEVQVGGQLPNLGEDGVSPTGVVSQLAAVMDSDENKQNFNSPHAAKWKQFREKNPEFKEYQRQASTSDSDRSFLSEGVDEESAHGNVFSGHGRGRGQFRTHSDHRTKRSSTERKRLMYEDEEGESSPANNEATKRNYQVIVSQAEEQMQRGEITMSQYNQLLQTVVSLVEQDKIKEARAENNQPYHGDESGAESDDTGPAAMHQSPDMGRGRGGPYMDRGRGFNRGGRMGIDGGPPGGPTVPMGPPGGPMGGRGGRGSPMDRGGHEGMRGHPRTRGRGGGDRGGHHMNEPVFDQDYECASEPELPEPSKDDIRFATDNIKNTCNIEIDKIMREIHIYGTTAIALMERDDPRELTFEDGMARIVFEGGKFILPMRIGEPYKEFKIDREPHRIRLGVPTRELFLDGVGYQCFFGNPGKPISILLAGKRRNIALNGMAPNVKIGSVRNIEYCAGKTEMVINAKKVVFLNLDGRPQKFVIDGKIFIIRFIDKLRSVNINGTVFPVEFGGKPISINVKGFRKYLSFQPLPKNIIPGQVSIRNMEGEPPMPHGRPKRHSPNRTEGPPAVMGPPGHPLHPPPPPPTGVAPVPHPPGPPVLHPPGPHPSGPPGPSQPHPSGPPGPSQPIQPGGMQQLGPHVMPLPGPPHILPGPPMPPPWLPPPTNVLPPGYDNTKAPPNMSYNTNLPPPVAPAQEVSKPLDIGNLDIGNLLAGLKKAGLIGPKENKSKDEADEKRLAEEEHLKEEENKIPMEVMFDSDNLRKRRSYLIHGLYNGMQCSSCGLRYPPEQTVQYSHHLDWHFRQNKRQQESTKKANARRFYFSIEDWLQYEEIEDVDERAPSKFELDGLEEPMDTSGDSEIPSIAIDESDESLSSCTVCHDVFNKFYHQDTEEWRYHNATQVEGVNYHPSCHEDIVNKRLAEEKAKEEKEMAETAAAEEAAAAAAAAEGDEEKSEAKEDDKENSEAKEGEKETSEANEADKDNSEAIEADKESLEADKENTEANEADKENTEANEADKESSTAKEADKENSEAMEGVAENSDETSEKEALPTENGVPNNDITDENSAKDNVSTENGDNVESSTGQNVEEANNAFQMVRIKEEPVDPSNIPDSSKTLPGGIKIKEEPGLLKVKEEPQDLPDPYDDNEDGYCLVEVDNENENLDESWMAPTIAAEIQTESTSLTSTIDGNMEHTTPEATAAPASVPRIKISLSKPSINNNNNNNNNDNTNAKGGVNNAQADGDDDFVAPAFTVDLTAKPHFRGVELEDMPLQCRGLELSGLCSIM